MIMIEHDHAVRALTEENSVSDFERALVANKMWSWLFMKHFLKEKWSVIMNIDMHCAWGWSSRKNDRNLIMRSHEDDQGWSWHDQSTMYGRNIDRRRRDARFARLHKRLLRFTNNRAHGRALSL